MYATEILGFYLYEITLEKENYLNLYNYKC